MPLKLLPFTQEKNFSTLPHIPTKATNILVFRLKLASPIKYVFYYVGFRSSVGRYLSYQNNYTAELSLFVLYTGLLSNVTSF